MPNPHDTTPAGAGLPATGGVSSAGGWYVVYTKPRQEHVALEQLRRQGFEAYLPLFRVFKRRRRAGQGAPTTHEPMFPRYLFMRPMNENQSLSTVRSTVGVSRLVVFGLQPARLGDAAVGAIRAAESARENASLNQINPWKPGMTVRLLDPALSSLEVLVQAVSNDRVTVLLGILGRPQSVQVGFEAIANDHIRQHA